MATFEELQRAWNQIEPERKKLDSAGLRKIIRRGARREMLAPIRYFWASFALQIMVYAMLAHVIATHWHDTTMTSLSIVGILLYVPFTILSLKKVKKLATAMHSDLSIGLYEDILRQQLAVKEFYTFKTRYELIQIPLSAIIGIILVFNLYVPGGVLNHPMGVMVTLVLTLASCAWAISSENKKSFEDPLRRSQKLLNELKEEDNEIDD